MRAIPHFIKRHLKLFHKISKTTFWFSTGVFLGLFLLISFGFLLFQLLYNAVIYPGVYIDNISVGGKTQAQVAELFAKRNEAIAHTIFTFTTADTVATMSARTLHLGYNGNLLAQQAFSVGRSTDVFSDISLIFQAYISGVMLSPSFTYRMDEVNNLLTPIEKEVKRDPINAIFTFQNNRVTTFK